MPRPGRLLCLLLFTASLTLFTVPNRLLGPIIPAARAAGSYTVNWPGDTTDGVCNDGNNRSMLRAAIQQANAVGARAR